MILRYGGFSQAEYIQVIVYWSVPTIILYLVAKNNSSLVLSGLIFGRRHLIMLDKCYVASALSILRASTRGSVGGASSFIVGERGIEL